jgi:deoxyribose-phosphate aldolase
MDARGVLDILDLTLLDHGASESDLDELCKRAELHRPAAVCVFSEHVAFVRERLDEGISVAAVVGGFPVGWQDSASIREAVESAVRAGADEVDCVLEPRDSPDFPGEHELFLLTSMREGSHGCKLKVIIETPLLSEHDIRAVSRMALAAGADFVKSCTGKRGSCSDEDARLLAFEIKRHSVTMGEERGVKLSGGIRVMDDVVRLLGIVDGQYEEISGPSRLRIGASSLLDDILG